MTLSASSANSITTTTALAFIGRSTALHPTPGPKTGSQKPRPPGQLPPGKPLPWALPAAGYCLTLRSSAASLRPSVDFRRELSIRHPQLGAGQRPHPMILTSAGVASRIPIIVDTTKVSSGRQPTGTTSGPPRRLKQGLRCTTGTGRTPRAARATEHEKVVRAHNSGTDILRCPSCGRSRTRTGYCEISER